MKTITKFIARLSILCYLVVASIASAHAFPMARTAQSNSVTMVTDIGSGGSQILAVEATAPMRAMQSDCHQTKTGSADASSMSLCKIFCAATSHALTTDIIVDLVLPLPPVQTVSVKVSFGTGQLVVEQRPPK
ncbi:MAG: hypothetical protein ACI9WC_002100 [Arenicella sp.]|jgi:hypothetical protein